MINEKDNYKKLCMFYASDYHFEMISLPYISNKLSNNKNVVILTENDLNKTVDKVLSMTIIKDEDKKRIKEIDWSNKRIENIKINEKKETVIFIKGKESYVKNINKNLINMKNVEIVDCYDLNEIQVKVSEISKKYDGVLATSGIEKL